MPLNSKQKQQKKVIDATVIDQCMLIQAVKQYLDQNKIIAKGSINFNKIKVLSLSFLNIWKIQYLESFGKLQKLQLDNNIIQKIQNISHLTKLTWLDLSFNNIKQIQGLDKLINLTDITFYNNKINQLDGLHNCPKLNIFSIGNNLIRSFQEVIAYFGKGTQKKTRFKYLQVLNVYGNPFTIKQGEKDTQYQYHLVANLPNLRYLDYIFIDEKRRKQIRDFDDKFKTQDQSKFLQQLRIQQQKERDQQQEKKKKENAKMHLLDGFSQDIVNIDELQKIQKLRGLQEQISKFTSKIKQYVETMQKKIKEENQKKLIQLKKSQQKLYQRQHIAQKKSQQAIKLFQKEQKNIQKIIDNKHSNPNWKSQTQKLKISIVKLKDTLLNVQVQLMEDAEALFKKQITQIIEENNKRIQIILSEEQKDDKNSDQTGFFKKIEDQIKEFGTVLEKISKEEIERYMAMQNAGEGDEYSSDADLNNMLESKDILGIVSNIKDMLTEKKGKKQSEIENEVITKEKEAYKKSYDDRQYDRNRKNVRNINEKINSLFAKINQVICMEDD